MSFSNLADHELVALMNCQRIADSRFPIFLVDMWEDGIVTLVKIAVNFVHVCHYLSSYWLQLCEYLLRI